MSRVALVVGINQYKSPYSFYPSLKFCAASAREAFELLTSPQFGQCEPAPVSRFLTDEKGEPVTPDMIRRAVEQISAQLTGDDLFLFYFSGHGDLWGSQLFLMTTGAKQAQDGFAYANMMASLGQRSVLHAILIVDACFSKTMFNSLRYWGDDHMPDNIGQLASADYKQAANEDPALGRTLFSYYFCQGIRKGCPGIAGPDSSVSLITVDTMAGYINNQLRENHGEYSQKAQLFQFGETQDLWIAPREPHAEFARPAKQLYSFEKVINTFQKDYIFPEECDRALDYLKLIRGNLNIPPTRTYVKNRVEERIDELIPIMTNYRPSGREKSSQAERTKATISRRLQIIYLDLESAKG